mmetsp:Transcript_5290/g.8922  ORF Transcript_5290/g.8922 Transcript_5290/m.8922 type:complete len:131 (-) Transcript_5290:275-667(-)
MSEEQKQGQGSHPKKPVTMKLTQSEQSKLKSEGQANQKQIFSRLDHDTLCNKFLESVAMIKQLHGDSQKLRDDEQKLRGKVEQNQSENFFLQNENRDLRDRIEILESVVASQTHDLNQDAWRDLLYPTFN